MAKRPENRRVDISPSDQMSLIMGIAKAVENRRGKKKDKEYQESLEEMGMFDNAGGREEFRGRAQRMKSGGKCRGMGAAKRGGDFMIG